MVNPLPGGSPTSAKNCSNELRHVAHTLAKTGDSDRKQILSEFTLVAGNPKANGGVFDVTSA